MATYKKQLQDKDGNTIYPDVGIDLDNVVYGDDPTTPGAVTPWIDTDDIQDGAVTSNKIDFTTYENVTIVVGGITSTDKGRKIPLGNGLSLIVANVNTIGHTLTSTDQSVEVTYSPSFTTSHLATTINMMKIGTPASHVEYGYASNGRVDAYLHATTGTSNIRTQFIALGVD